ncbi:MAG: ABC transporter ATP-binding protein [Spirochaetales bacterium]|jgi:ATP-binding cassette, subfamily B, multidrug efflux pump|nr:ABC transporter ATP-binding protein [Spirochaetales bacterium]
MAKDNMQHGGPGAGGRPGGASRPAFRPGGPGRGMHGGMPVEKPKNFKKTLKRLVKYLKPRRVALTAVFFAAIVSTIFAILSPKILGRATTKLFEGLMMKMRGVPNAAIDFDYILRIVLILVGLYVISAVFMFIQQFIMAGVAQKTVYDLRETVSSKLTRLPLKFFDSRTHGEILSRVTNDIDLISTTLQQSVAQIITAVVTLIGVIIMMFSINWVLTVVIMITLPVSFMFLAPILKRSQRYFAAQQKTLGEINGHVEEMYAGHKIVKAFGHEERSINKFNGINERLYGAGWKAQFISGIIMPLMMFVNNIGYVVVCVVGGVLVTKGAIKLGDIQAFIQYARQFSQPIQQTANISNVLQSTIAAAERVFEILDEEEEAPAADNAPILKNPKGEVKIEHVSFSYEETKPLIEDMNIDVKQGQTIAIVGPTGAGKTTLVNLLMRFYEISKGRISVDGVDIRELEREGLRSIFGMVLQDTWLFNGTIRENIGYGREGLSEEDIVAAAVTVHADHFIRTLPDGYDTILNEEASNISQGQKQLLTIARAILADPAILILDEATSSVDSRTEILIQKAMNELMRGRTNFVIAHRLSTIRDADLILVMNEGTIIETGTHTQLLEQDGFYADLYNSQFKGINRQAG